MGSYAWQYAGQVAFISYCDMGFGAMSIVLSILAFINYLPMSREGHEFAHDFITFTFMGSILIHFFQLSKSVMLLNSAESPDAPHESKQLAKSWQNWSIVFLVLLVVKLNIVLLSFDRGLWFYIFVLFISLEISYRVYWRFSVQEFINDLETCYPTEVYYSPYLWSH